MAGSNIALIEAFLAPMTIDQFRSEIWPDNLLVMHGHIGRLPAPFNNPELSNYRELFSRYRGQILFHKGSKNPRSVLIDNVNPTELYDMGLTLYLLNIEPVVYGATEFLRALEKALGLSIGASRITVWASQSGEGTACHFDGEEVFSIQLQGIKRFYVSKNKAHPSFIGRQFGPNITPTGDQYLQMSNGFPCVDDFEFSELEMRPGSVLYMPRGMWHRTEADQNSLSVTIAISNESVADCFLRELRTLLLQDEDWRRPLYGMVDGVYNDKSTPDRLNSIFKSLPNIIKNIRPEDLTLPHKSEVLANIQHSTRFQKIPNSNKQLVWHIDHEVIRLHVITKPETTSSVSTAQLPGIVITPQYLNVIKWLETSKAAFSVEDLINKFEGISLQEHRTVLTNLERLNFLQLLWFRQLSIS